MPRLIVKSADFKPSTPAPSVRIVAGVCEHEGRKFYAARTDSGELSLCVPTERGTLLRTGSRVDLKDATFHNLKGVVMEDGKVRPFMVRPEFELSEKMVKVEEDKRVVDYQNVGVSGLASTFGWDRDRERVKPGAFKRTLADFAKNPVMLMDHVNSVKNIVGSFSRFTESAEGLLVEGMLSNSPEVRAVRFLVAEKHLRAFSIGGMLKYSLTDFQEIEEVQLFEISLVAVPANQDSLFITRALDLDTAKKAFQLISL